MMMNLRIIVLFVFFLSGACGLIYEVLWVRMLTLVFGSTTYAVSTVLCAFMAGLALGSYLLGRLVDRTDKIPNPLRLYAILEIGLGLYCFFTPLLFKLVEYTYLHFAHSTLHSTTSSIIVRFLLAFIVILIPTALMGGTLPVLSKFFVQQREKLGWNIGLLYSINTWGAVLGTFATGFILISLLGVKTTLYTAAIINLAIGLGVYIITLLSRGPQFVSGSSGAFEERANQIQSPKGLLPEGEIVQGRLVLHPAIMLLAFGFSGFSALAYEVTWTKGLTLILGTTTYAFSTMLTTFLFGLALGSIIFAKWIDRKKDLVSLFALIQIIIGLSALLLVPVFTGLPYLFLEMYKISGPFWGQVIGIKFILSFLVMLIPTTLLGASFPLVSKLYIQNIKKIGGKIGSIYSVNTIGAIIGSFSAGFILIPLLGIQRSIIACASINFLIGAVILYANPLFRFKIRRFYGLALLSLPILGLIYIPSWHKLTLSRGVYLFPQRHLERLKGEAFEPSRQLLYYAEGREGTVAVIREGDRGLLHTIDGWVVASNYYGDVRIQRMMGHLPVLLHPKPQKVLVIGLGLGGTLGAVAQHNLEEIECVEIEPKVLTAAQYFHRINQDVLSHSQVKITIEDGRNFLLTTKKKYDVITTDPIHPLHRGSSPLYSRDYFELCKKRLTENGIMAQWVPLFFLSPQEYKMIIKTFKSVFPQATLWFTNVYTILIGKRSKLEIDYLQLRQKLSESRINQSLKKVDLDEPYAFLNCFLMGKEELTELVKNASINTDNHPKLEFSAPKNLYSQTIGINLELINSFRKDSIFSYLVNYSPADKERLRRCFLARDFIIKGIIAEEKGDIQGSILAYQKACQINPGDRNNRVFLYHALSKRNLKESSQ